MYVSKELNILQCQSMCWRREDQIYYSHYSPFTQMQSSHLIKGMKSIPINALKC